MSELKAMLLKMAEPYAKRFTNDLADLMVAKIETQFGQLAGALDVALSSYAGDLEEPEVPVASTPSRAVQRPKQKAKITEKTGRQNHCKKCGAAGFQTKTCGISHDANGRIERPRTTRKTKAAANEEDDEGEPAAIVPPARRAAVVEAPLVAHADRVPAAEPPAAKGRPGPATSTLPPDHPDRDLRTITRAEAAELERTQPVVRVTVPRFNPPMPPKKTVKRERALKEIRIEQLRKAAELRQRREDAVENARIPAEPDDEDLAPLPSRRRATKVEAEDEGEGEDVAPLTEREVLTDFRAADLD